MLRILPVNASDQQEQFCGLNRLTAAELATSHADGLFLAIDEQNVPVGSYGLWWRSSPQQDGFRTGAIGYYSAVDDQVGRQLLHAACQRLQQEDCGFALGPLDGSTWRRYRAVTETTTQPPFFLEPDYSAQTCHQFQAAGFTAVATYHSALVEDLQQCPPANREALRQFTESGGAWRPFDLEHFDDELRKIYKLTITAFDKSPYFTPLPFAEFQALFSNLRKCVVPELFLLAEKNDELLGFLFALPDYLQMRRGAAMDTLVIKSLVIAPAAAGRGLGSLLTAEVHRRARERGFRRAIHALMHHQNPSLRISQHSAKVFRTYALLGKVLPPVAP
jgi:L-amino acid N-acyltransferase YncA